MRYLAIPVTLAAIAAVLTLAGCATREIVREVAKPGGSAQDARQTLGDPIGGRLVADADGYNHSSQFDTLGAADLRSDGITRRGTAPATMIAWTPDGFWTLSESDLTVSRIKRGPDGVEVEGFSTLASGPIAAGTPRAADVAKVLVDKYGANLAAIQADLDAQVRRAEISAETRREIIEAVRSIISGAVGTAANVVRPGAGAVPTAEGGVE